MRRFVVANMKGGVGKTTTAIHLAAGLAARKQRTLLIDTDPQGNVGHTLQAQYSKTVRELMLGESNAGETIVPEVRPNLDVIVSTTAAFSLERQLAGEAQRETVLSRRLSRISGYDAVVLDTSPSMSLLTFNALLYGQEIIIPIGMDSMALIGARQTLNGIAEIQELWPERDLRILAILPTAVNVTTIASRATLEALEADPSVEQHLYKPGIRQCIDLTYATSQQQTIWEYAPRSRAAEDFNAFLDHVEGKRKPEEARAHHG